MNRYIKLIAQAGAMKYAAKRHCAPPRAASDSANLCAQESAKDHASADRSDHQGRVADVPSSEQIIQEARDHQKRGLDALDVLRGYLIRLFMRIEHLSDSIDIAFAGQPFRADLAPDDPKNRRRFRAYLHAHKEVVKLSEYAIRLWMVSFGMKPEDDWAPIVIEDMRLKHAAAIQKQTGC